MEKIIIYCDGGCRGNGKEQNLGSWAAVLICGDHKKEIYEAVENTTNNQMELRAAIMALNEVKRFNLPVEVISDSQYVVSGMNEWTKNWKKNGWKTANKKPVENKEIWLQLLSLSEKFANIIFTKTRGHADDEGNNRVDELCNIAMDEVQL